jgi:GTP:adenosylcobinamide-phosphate guanylyltransferase
LIAAITAGGRVDGALAAALGTTVKALARVGTATLLDAAIAAAREAGAKRIAVIGGAEVRAHCSRTVDVVIDESTDGRENLRRAIATGTDQPLLLLTSDLPFVDGASLAAFLCACGDADVALPLASAAEYERAYPGAPPHVTRIGKERVANGSVVYFAPNVAPRVLVVAGRLFEARKSLVRMAALLGPALLARFAMGTLTVGHVEARAQALLGIRARAVRDAAPNLCYDVDTLDDYRYALAYAARAEPA